MSAPRNLRRVAAAVIGVGLAGCGTMAPTYERPAAPVAARFPPCRRHRRDRHAGRRARLAGASSPTSA